MIFSAAAENGANTMDWKTRFPRLADFLANIRGNMFRCFVLPDTLLTHVVYKTNVRWVWCNKLSWFIYRIYFSNDKVKRYFQSKRECIKLIEALIVRLKCTNKNMQKQFCVLDNLSIPQGVMFHARVWLLHAHKSTLVWVDKDGVIMKHYPNLWKNVWLFLPDCPIFSLVFPPCPPLSLKFFHKFIP